MSIVNLIEIIPEHVLDLINCEKFDFFLTGSRYFGTATQTSDWDFFADYSVDLCQWLENSGFRKKSECDYDDTTIVKVYSYMGIDVQLVKNKDLKNLAQRVLKKNNLFGKDKQLNRLLWNAVLAGLTEDKPKK